MTKSRNVRGPQAHARAEAVIERVIPPGSARSRPGDVIGERFYMNTRAAEAEEPVTDQHVETNTEDPLIDNVSAAIKKLAVKAKQRGYVTEAEMNEAFVPEQFSSDQIEDALARLAEIGVNIVDNEEAEPEPAAA